MAPGEKRLTPNGAFQERAAAISVASASGVLYPAARNGNAPADTTPAPRARELGPPAMGAATIGNRLSSSGLVVMPPQPCLSGPATASQSAYCGGQTSSGSAGSTGWRSISRHPRAHTPILP